MNDSLQNKLMLEMLQQNLVTCGYAFDQVSQENSSFRLNEKTGSVGFIYRHIGETMNLFGQFFGIATNVQNSTMGQIDGGQYFELQVSQQLIVSGYAMLRKIVQESADADWLLGIDTPFFGTVSRARLFAHILFHNAHHAGQISLTLAKGQSF